VILLQIKRRFYIENIQNILPCEQLLNNISYWFNNFGKHCPKMPFFDRFIPATL